MYTIVRERGEQYCWVVYAYVVDQGMVRAMNANREAAYDTLRSKLNAMGVEVDENEFRKLLGKGVDNGRTN